MGSWGRVWGRFNNEKRPMLSSCRPFPSRNRNKISRLRPTEAILGWEFDQTSRTPDEIVQRTRPMQGPEAAGSARYSIPYTDSRSSFLVHTCRDIYCLILPGCSGRQPTHRCGMFGCPYLHGKAVINPTDTPVPNETQQLAGNKSAHLRNLLVHYVARYDEL